MLILPEILSELPSYELSSRNNVEELNDEYHIFCICDSDEPNEFCIDFVYDDEDADEVTTVYFKDGNYDDWSYMH